MATKKSTPVKKAAKKVATAKKLLSIKVKKVEGVKKVYDHQGDELVQYSFNLPVTINQYELEIIEILQKGGDVQEGYGEDTMSLRLKDWYMEVGTEDVNRLVGFGLVEAKATPNVMAGRETSLVYKLTKLGKAIK